MEEKKHTGNYRLVYSLPWEDDGANHHRSRFQTRKGLVGAASMGLKRAREVQCKLYALALARPLTQSLVVYL